MAVRIVAGLAVAVVSTACSAGAPKGTAADAGPDATDALGAADVLDAMADVPIPYLVGASVTGIAAASVTLLEEPHPAFVGTLAPLVVPGPDGRLLYSTYRGLATPAGDAAPRPGEPEGLPFLRIHDPATGVDEIFAEGGASAAWRPDGAIAWFQADPRTHRTATRFSGHVHVREPDGTDTRWSTEAGRYLVAGFAHGMLVVHRLGAGEAIETVAFDAPGLERSLGHGAVVALAPDGDRVVIGSTDALRLVEVATGRVADEIPLPFGAGGREVSSVGYSGSWRGDRLVAEVPGGLAVFAIDGDVMSVTDALWIEPGADAVGEGPVVDEPVVNEPVLVSRDRVVAWAVSYRGEGYRSVVLDCRLSAGRCSRSRTLAGTRLRAVRNLSRPA